jgi:hypothetical protein
VAYLRRHNAPNTIALSSYNDNGRWRTLKSAEITHALRTSVIAIGSTVGLTHTEISARSLRASGAMALLLGGVNVDVIKIIGRWQSDEVLRYLHVSA